MLEAAGAEEEEEGKEGEGERAVVVVVVVQHVVAVVVGQGARGEVDADNARMPTCTPLQTPVVSGLFCFLVFVLCTIRFCFFLSSSLCSV